jgi:hypothetical protein
VGAALSAVIALVCAASAAPPPTRPAPIDAYRAMLSRICPAKRLDRLAPAELLDDIEAFPRSLPPRVRDRLQRNAATVEARCAYAAGASCSNAEWLRAIERLRLTRRLAARVCSAHLSCRAQSDCD